MTEKKGAMTEKEIADAIRDRFPSLSRMHNAYHRGPIAKCERIACLVATERVSDRS